MNKCTFKKYVFYSMISMILGFIVFSAMLCVLAIVLCNVDLPLNILPPITLGALCVAVFFASFVFALLIKRKGLIFGAVFGLVVYTILLIVSAVHGANLLTQLSAIKAFSIICSGAFGGYLGILKSEHKRKIRR